MSAPGFVWDANVSDALSAGASISFVALGPEDTQSPSADDVLGWFVFFDMANGERKVLVKSIVCVPRMFKTYAGIAAFTREHCHDWKTITLPLLPQIRSVKEAWGLVQLPSCLDDARPATKPRPVPEPSKSSSAIPKARRRTSGKIQN